MSAHGVWSAAIAVVASLLLFAVAFAQTAADDAPTTAPARIISCAPNLTEMLFALGAGDAVIGVTRYCENPPEAKTRAKFGDLFDPNLEGMVAARPDAIAFYRGNARVGDYFRKVDAGVRLIETNNCETIAQVEETIAQLGTATGHAREAERLLESLRAGMDEVRAQSAGAPPVRVLFVLSRQEGSLRQLVSIGPGTYLTELLEAAGGANALEGVTTDLYPQINREALLRVMPDVIIELHHAADTPDQRAEIERAWRDWAVLPAVRDGRIVIVADPRLLVPGIGMVEGARTLRATLTRVPAATP